MSDALRAPVTTANPNRWWILAILCGSLVLVVVSVSSLNVALPPIQLSLGASGSDLQWIVDAYALVFAGLLLPAGAIGDRYGRKGALLVGLVVFGVASLAAVFVSTPVPLIATRTVMGAAAAFIMPATLSILTVVFPPEERAKAIAIWAGFAGAGGAIGIISSGLLLEKFWWGSIFFVNLPIVLVTIVAVVLVVPTSRDTDHRPLDPVGAVVSIVGLVALIYAIIEGPEAGWTSPITLTSFVVAAVSLTAFVRWELRSQAPMLDPRFFRNRYFTIGSLTITLVFVGMFGLFFLITQYFQFVQGTSPLGAGVRMLPIALTLVVVSPIGPRFVTRFGARMVMTVGTLIAAAGFIIVASLEPSTSYVWMATALVLIGAGMAMLMPPATTAIVTSLPLNKAGVGSAVNDTTREVGGAIGIAVMGSLLAIGYRSSLGDAVDVLPQSAREGALDSIGGLLQVIPDLPADIATSLTSAGNNAFTDGFQLAMLVAAGVLAVTAAIIFFYYPRGSSYSAPDTVDVEPEDESLLA